MRPAGAGYVQPMSHPHRLREILSEAARRVATLAASGPAFLTSLAFVTAWLVTGVATGFPYWWHIILHSIAGAVTLLMVFAIEHGTRRDSHAILLKLDELIRVTSAARNDVIDVENKPLGHQEKLADQVVDGVDTRS